jgi:FtsH-binding integral membrane protein
MEKGYKNLGFILILLIPLTFLGFLKTYFIQIPTFEENITPYIHIHAVIASVWILILIAQPLLIRNRKNKFHKKIGKISYVLFPLLILSFIPQMIRIINSDNPNILFFPLADSLSLTLFYSLAIYHRKNVSKHMRYMIGTALVFLGPTIGRIGPRILGLSENVTQNSQYGLIYLILIGLIIFDRKHQKNYQPYLIILSIWIIHQITFNLIF